MFYELMVKNCRTGEGWNEDLFQALLKMDDELIQKDGGPIEICP